jgi:hypothetical protein
MCGKAILNRPGWSLMRSSGFVTSAPVRSISGTSSISRRFQETRYRSTTTTRYEQKNSQSSIISLAAAAIISVSIPMAVMSDANADSLDSSTSSAVSKDMSSRCRLPWVAGTNKTIAECSLHQNQSKEEDPLGFNPGTSRYFEIKLAASSSADNNNEEVCSKENNNNSSTILHNKVIVLPDLITSNECKSLCEDAERILAENKARNVRGCKTERWTVYSRFGKESQKVMDRVLGEHILAFLELRMPDVAKQIFSRGVSYSAKKRNNNTKETMSFYWDDPVVIKYSAGNQLAPHEDMREITVVIPLNPLDQYPLGGGGTRFWLQGTTQANDSDGISVKPSPGSGILFNGEITHSGNEVVSGTRFVLMTSITFDEEEDDEDDEE